MSTMWSHAMCYNFHKFWIKCVSLLITLPFKLHTTSYVLSVFYFIETLKLYFLPRLRSFCTNARFGRHILPRRRPLSNRPPQAAHGWTFSLPVQCAPGDRFEQCHFFGAEWMQPYY